MITESKDLRSALIWWEKKRILYNLLVGLFGVVGLLWSPHYDLYGFQISDIYWILIWALGANVFYSMGFMVEALAEHYFKGRFSLVKWRWLLWTVGVIFSIGWTIVSALNYV